MDAAFASGMSRQVNEFIDLRIVSGLPSGLARALMVAGFSDSNNHAFETLQRFSNDKGLLGAAGKVAQFAYEGNVWARDWYERMRMAKSNEEFWSSSVLLEKIVDSRYAQQASCSSSSFRRSRNVSSRESNVGRANARTSSSGKTYPTRCFSVDPCE